MIYGHGTRASAIFGDSGPPCVSAGAAPSLHHCWRRLDGERRLALVEGTLRPANKPPDPPIWRSDRNDLNKETDHAR